MEQVIDYYDSLDEAYQKIAMLEATCNGMWKALANEEFAPDWEWFRGAGLICKQVREAVSQVLTAAPVVVGG